MLKFEKRGEKTAIAIQIMEANVAKPKAEVIQMLAEAFGQPTASGAAYYRSMIVKGLVKGYGVEVKASKAPKVKAAKPDAAKAATEKTLEALADLKLIKAKNLKTLKEVSALRSSEDRKRMDELADFENSLEEEGARNFVPKFLHKELGIQ
jgi:ABC-type uncharacterized transport system YnjBCD substrate-binding protein